MRCNAIWNGISLLEEQRLNKWCNRKNHHMKRHLTIGHKNTNIKYFAHETYWASKTPYTYLNVCISMHFGILICLFFHSFVFLCEGMADFQPQNYFHILTVAHHWLNGKGSKGSNIYITKMEPTYPFGRYCSMANDDLS